MGKGVQESIRKVTSKLEKTFKAAITPAEMRAVGDEAALIVVRRSRLGFGSPVATGGQRFAFAALSPGYISFRQGPASDVLSQASTARKSNVTFTGQMLDSVKVVLVTQGTAIIAPTGERTDRYSPPGLTNREVAGYLAKKGRSFLSLTQPELSQLLRFYRTRFGDLVRRT